ncbi:hypothetical protein F5887DRAFT_1164314 [Amanita rubescens]|nr:hypothetical protein F5887DRAFT_1164314 [Amanita rubescens]
MRLALSISRVLSIVALASFAGAVTVPGADTPSFYLPLRTSGGTGDYASLTGNGPIGVFYFFQGRLTASSPSGDTNTQRPLISGDPVSTGCTTYGPLGFVQGSSTNKCALFDAFQIQPDTENSQLGAGLTFNYVGGFYACGSGQDVWYKVHPEDGPSDCTSITLWTVPV